MKLTIICTTILFTITAGAQDHLSLPDPLTTSAGEQVTTVEQWQETRRPEILELFRTNVYGRTPIGRPDDLRFEVQEINEDAMDGRATLKRIDIHFSGHGGAGVIKLVLFIPNQISKPAPGFLLIAHRSPDKIDPTRETISEFWPAEVLVERGYVAAAFLSSNLDPDRHDGFQNGVHGIFDPQNSERSADAWGTIAAWSWGASRVMDYFETDEDIDETRIGVVGHSRGGKAALWCGAEDERFALTISNNSGCTGAALARNKKGERVARINNNFPHWFCTNYKSFNDKEDDLPIDQHELIALMAPRLAYVASASEDSGADPEGEFLSCVHAHPVYQLFDLQGVGATTMPQAQQPLHNGHIGHHIREGKHDLNEYDWNRYMDFSDKHWRKSTTKFDLWRSENFGDGTLHLIHTQPNADPDGDGIKNIIEFATGQDPTSLSSNPISAVRSDENLTLYVPKRLNSELNYKVTASSSLTHNSWENLADTYPFTSHSIEGDIETLSIEVSNTLPRQFFRIEVEE